MNPVKWSFRQFCLFGLVCCLSLLGFALYAQHVMFLIPCPLCVLQRVAFMVMAVGFGLGALFGLSGWGRGVAVALGILGGAGGIGVAGRHIWLQHLPEDQVPACGPGLNYLIEAFPLRDVLVKVFQGSGECAKLDWSFLGLSMPTWTLLWYIGLVVATLFYLLRSRRVG